MADLSQYPTDVMQAAISALRKNGITNLQVQAAVLATIAKESGFVPKSEISYAHTSNDRIRYVFPTATKNLTDEDITDLKANNNSFFDLVYGNRNGNTSPGDGWKYRGRGLNQITFKNEYKQYGDMIGVDLVNNPDLLNDPKIAAAAAAAFFATAFKQGKASGKLKEKVGVNDISEITDTNTAVKATIQANAGWGTNFNSAIVQEGYNKALATVNDFKNGILNTFSAITKTVSENKGTATAVFFLGHLHWLMELIK